MFFNQAITVTVAHRSRNTDGDYTVTDSYELAGCAVSVRSRARAYATENAFEEYTRGDLTLFAPTGSDIRSDDTVTLPNGDLFHVWGYATDFSSPFTGWQPGMQVPLRSTRG